MVCRQPQPEAEASPILSAGTAIYSKIKPLSVKYHLPDVSDADIVTGRLVILEFASCFVVGLYAPNAGAKLKVLALSASPHELS